MHFIWILNSVLSAEFQEIIKKYAFKRFINLILIVSFT